MKSLLVYVEDIKYFYNGILFIIFVWDDLFGVFGLLDILFFVDILNVLILNGYLFLFFGFLFKICRNRLEFERFKGIFRFFLFFILLNNNESRRLLDFLMFLNVLFVFFIVKNSIFII